tara:strand:+ start:1772 stop:2110 length:339 start_codon:yes stop_codon:yes gene_type:complete
MIPQEENYAEQIRQAGKAVQEAEEGVAKADADEKREIASQMLHAQQQGLKSAAAQAVFADASEAVYQKRLQRGVAKGGLAAAKANLVAAETAVRVWQTKMSMLKLEARTYNV